MYISTILRRYLWTKTAPCLFYGKSLPLSFDLTGNILELNPFFGIPNFGFLIDALKVMPSSINASNGPLIGAALVCTKAYLFTESQNGNSFCRG